MAAADTTKPTLTSLVLPSKIDVTSTSTSVTVTAGASDVGLGVDSISIRLNQSYQTPYGRSSSFYISDYSDSFSDGVSSTTDTFTTLTSAGTYNIDSIYVYDKAGNYTYYDTTDLKNLGFQTSFEVAGTTADTTKPTLTSLVLPSKIDVTSTSTSVTVTAGASDVGLGVDSISIRLNQSYQTPYGRSSSFYISDYSDSFSDGVSSTTDTFTTLTSAGTYNIDSIYVYDKAGNYTYYDTTDLKNLGFQTSFDVTDSTADTSKPSITALAVPETIDVSLGNATANVTVNATDVGLGVQSVFVNLDKSLQTPNGPASGFYLYDSQDSFADGSASVSQTVTTTTAAGTYGIVSVVVTDKAGNTTTYLASELTALGYATAFTVKNDPPDTTKPTLTALSLPSAVNVSNGDVPLAVTVSASDVGKGVASVQIELDTPVLTREGLLSVITLTDEMDSFGDGRSSLTQTLSAQAALGNYGIKSVTVTDRAGNSRVYGRDDLSALGIQTSFDVTDTNRISGTANDDVLKGSALKDRIDGGEGADTLYGYGNDDTYLVDNAGDRVFEEVGDGSDTILTRVSYAIGADEEVEKLSIEDSGTVTALNLYGSNFSNTLRGNAGANLLDGRGGADTLYGLSGNDTYLVDHVGDRVFEDRSGGSDTVVATVSYALTAGQDIEALALAKSTGTANLKLVGNEFGNILQGNAGNNVLDGKEGSDTLSGLGGNDIYVVDQADDVVIEATGKGNDTILSTVSYTLAAGQEVETLQFATQAAQTAIDLFGNEFANTLRGNAGRNILDGRGGADALYGLGGDDLYIVDNGSDLVFEAKGGGVDTIVSTVSYAMAAGQEIEQLELSGVTGTRALNLIGNEFANTLRGNSGNNTLDGGRGIDTAIGGRGNDTYWVDNAKDVVVEAVGAGHDTLIATVSYSLAAGQSIEVLRLAGTASLDLAGNALAQTIVGNVGANILDGKGGADILQGGKGNDIYVVDSAADRVVEGRGAGVDIVVAGVSYTLAAGQEIEAMQFSASVGTASLNLTGNEFGQTLFGNGGANVLNGGLGNDTLAGKLGADTLIGGRGADIFRFDTQVGRGNVDRISDFSHADDTIHLSKDVFSTLMKGKLAASGFKDIGAAGATIDASDRVLYDSRDGALYYDANGSGSGGRTLIAVIDNDAKLDHTDFFVV